jgi:hypothetical protein
MDWVMNIEDYPDEDRRDEFISQASQVRLLEEFKMDKAQENVNLKEFNTIVGHIDEDFSEQFNQEKMENEVIRINVIEHSNFDEDYEQEDIMKMEKLESIQDGN